MSLVRYPMILISYSVFQTANIISLQLTLLAHRLSNIARWVINACKHKSFWIIQHGSYHCEEESHGFCLIGWDSPQFQFSTRLNVGCLQLFQVDRMLQNVCFVMNLVVNCIFLVDFHPNPSRVLIPFNLTHWYRFDWFERNVFFFNLGRIFSGRTWCRTDWPLWRWWKSTIFKEKRKTINKYEL